MKRKCFICRTYFSVAPTCVTIKHGLQTTDYGLLTSVLFFIFSFYIGTCKGSWGRGIEGQAKAYLYEGSRKLSIVLNLQVAEGCD